MSNKAYAGAIINLYEYTSESMERLKTYRVRGTELSSLLLVRSADPADRRCDRQTDRQTDRRTDGQTDGRTDGRTDGQTDGRTDGRADGQTDRHT